MPIRIKQTPEPLSRSSFDEESVVIGSNSVNLLTDEIRRYCRGQINGRSILISGHRGSGKTTLVASAFIKVCKEIDSEQDGRPLLRPLLVPMNGTTLLPARPAEDGAKRGPLRPKARAAETERETDDSREALKQITLCLYRALAKEVALEFRRRAVRPRRAGVSREVTLSGLELAAQFELELFDCPEPERLREFWQRAGFLSNSRSVSLFAPPPWRQTTRDGEGHGFRELVALSSASDAYRRVSGTWTKENIHGDAAEEKAESEIGVSASGRDILNLMTVLLTGSLAGTAVLATQRVGAIGAAAAGSAAALATSSALKYRHQRSRARHKTRESRFQIDLTLATLDRTLPILIDRILEAGLAPIFVVDELDKVEDLSSRMGELVKQLKKLVAEQSFFCFLTDRDYFEEIRTVRSGTSYTQEYTYFTHQIYTVFEPADFHAYLARVLGKPEPVPRAVDAPSPSDDPWRDEEERRQLQEEAVDLPLLPYLLLHRAKMHVLDLNRQLVQLRDEHGFLALLPGRPRNLANRLELVMQVAVEMTLARMEIGAQLDRSPASLRLIYDALYFPSRQWEAGRDLRFDQSGIAEFDAYLMTRIGLNPSEHDAGAGCSVQDFALLLESVKRLSDLLSDWNAFLGAFEEWKLALQVDPAVADAIRQTFWSTTHGETPPLIRKADDLFIWRYDATGMPRDHGTEEFPNSWEGSAKEIERFNALFDSIDATTRGDDRVSTAVDFSALSSQLRILSTSPAWPVTQRALKSLRQAKRERRTYLSAAADADCVKQFAAMVQGSAELLFQCLLCGAVVGRASKRQLQSERLLAGLQAIARSYRFEEKSGAEVRVIVKDLTRTLRSRFANLPVIGGELRLWKLEQLKDCLAAIDRDAGYVPDVLASQRIIWEAWRTRLEHGLVSRKPDIDLADLYAHAAADNSEWLLDFNLDGMTIRHWNTLLFRSLLGLDESAAGYVPPWMAEVALYALGVRSAGRRFLMIKAIAGDFSLAPAPTSSWPSTPETLAPILFLRSSYYPLADAWRPSPLLPVIMLNRSSLAGNSAEARLAKSIAQALVTRTIEHVRNVPNPLLKVFRIKPAPPLSGRRGVIAFLRRIVPKASKSAPTLVSVTGLDDLISFLLHHQSE